MTTLSFARSAHGRFVVLLTLIAATLLLVTGNPQAAPAAPGATDPEGGTPALRKALADASQGYSTAKAKLAASRKRHAELVTQSKIVEAKVASLSKDVNALANIAYRGGEPNLLAAALDSGSMDTFLGKSEMVTELSRQNNAKISELVAARDDMARQKRKLDAEIKVQAAQEKAMAKRKADASRALGIATRGFTGDSNARASRSAPRNSDGSFPSQGCTEDDPTTSGCLSPRTLSALQQAKAAGFTRYVACFRQASFGEHGKGRACDFAAQKDGFGGVASGGDKTYGNNLANYFINNADRLGVLYVIWFRQIWMPGNGWSSYSGGNGDPSSDHTNHVHLSVQ
jgi:peptidoglycan DL-endopeptidase CwlO